MNHPPQEVEESAFGSASAVAIQNQLAFECEWRFTCACPRELRLEGNRYRCAKCDAPILKRRRVE